MLMALTSLIFNTSLLHLAINITRNFIDDIIYIGIIRYITFGASYDLLDKYEIYFFCNKTMITNKKAKIILRNTAKLITNSKREALFMS